MFLSARSSKPNRIYSLKMSKTADFDTLLYMVGGYSQGGANAPPPLNETLLIVNTKLFLYIWGRFSAMGH